MLIFQVRHNQANHNCANIDFFSYCFAGKNKQTNTLLVKITTNKFLIELIFLTELSQKFVVFVVIYAAFTQEMIFLP